MPRDGQNEYGSEFESNYLTVTEFAKLLSVSKKTVSRAIRRGKIQAINIGNATKKLYRIPRSEINRIALFDLESLVEKIIETKINSK